MGGSVAGRFQPSFHHVTVEVYHHHIVCCHYIVIHSGGFDDHQPACTVDSRDVSPSENHQSMLHQVKVGTEYFLF